MQLRPTHAGGAARSDAGAAAADLAAASLRRGPERARPTGLAGLARLIRRERPGGRLGASPIRISERVRGFEVVVELGPPSGPRVGPRGALGAGPGAAGAVEPRARPLAIAVLGNGLPGALEMAPAHRGVDLRRGRSGASSLAALDRDGVPAPARAAAWTPGAAAPTLTVLEDRVCVKGDPRLVCAVLGGEAARRVILEVVGQRGADLDAGVLRWCDPAFSEGSAERARAKIGAIVSDLVDLAEHLACDPAEVDGRLRAIARSDPDPRVRVEAARNLGREGVTVAVEIAGNAGAIPAARIGALEILATHAQVPALREIGAEIFATAPDQVKVALLRALAVSAVALGDLEAPVLDLVELSPRPVKIAAVELLAELGTANAVGPVATLAAGHTPGDPLVRALARDAIGRIQTRCGEGQGRLAIVSDDRAGALSFTTSGALSVMKDDNPG